MIKKSKGTHNQTGFDCPTDASLDLFVVGRNIVNFNTLCSPAEFEWMHFA